MAHMIRFTEPMSIGPALGELRRMLGITQRQLCADTGQRQSRLSVWETGSEVPDLRSVLRVAQALGYDLALIPRRPEPCDHPQGTGTICDICGGDVAALALIPREDTP